MDREPKKEPSWWWLLLTPVLFVIGWIGMGDTHDEGLLGFLFILICTGSLYFPFIVLLPWRLAIKEDNNRPAVYAHGIDIIRYAPDAETALAGLEKAGWRRPVYINDR